MKQWLLDTGPLVAALDAGDPAHDQVKRTLVSFSGSLITTGAVLTEAFYLLRYARSGAERLVEFVETTGTSVVDVFSVENLHRITQLMNKYADHPMDFADAGLVLIAEEKGHNAVLTLDERGFRTYRFRGNRRFDLVLKTT
jgi:predicted nucleic acid-binding protein